MMKTAGFSGSVVSHVSVRWCLCLLVPVCVALLAGSATVANAQTVVPARASAEASWFVSAGFDPFDFDLRTRDPGVQGQAFGVVGRIWSREGSGLGIRAQLTWGADLPHGIALGESCAGCEVGYRRTFGALAALATYSWRQSGAIQPYVVGGSSVHYTQSGFVVKGVLTREAASKVPLPTPATFWSAGVSAGVGLNFKLGRQSLFVEQSILLPAIIGRASSSGEQVSLPLSIGVRF